MTQGKAVKVWVDGAVDALDTCDKLVKNIANKYIGKVVGAGIPVSSAYLFGSYAKNNANVFSDIDICVISSEFGDDYFEDSLKLKNIANKIDYRIEPVPFAIHDMNDKYSTLASEIKKYGILLTN